MQFNSYIFILVYLPVIVIGYFLINKINYKAGKIFMTIGGALFYLYAGWKNALIFASSIIINYLFSLYLSKKENKRRLVLWIDIIFNILLLFFFKYTKIGTNIILPLGISFFTFQQIMYVVNIYKKEIDKNSLGEYLLYILYFPKLLMGPITEPKFLLEQFNDEEKKKVNWNNLANGLKCFSFGLFKKMLIADTFALAVNWGFTNFNKATSLDILLVMLFYTFQIYFDFSGYIDMAVGASTMLNIELPINFDSPYKALSIRDFWKRWHISLTGFFTKYVYIPLGGNRKGTLRTYLNIMIVFVVSGIWHGNNWTFVLWGVLHGLLSIFDRVIDKFAKKIFKPIRWIIAFLEINILWLLFRANSIAEWWKMLKRIFGFKSFKLSKELYETFILTETPFLLDTFKLEKLAEKIPFLNLILFSVFAILICLIPNNNYRNLKKNNYFMMVLAALALVSGLFCLSSESVFVYFNF